MALGDIIYGGSTSINAAGNFLIRPTTGIDWIVNEIAIPDGTAASVYRVTTVNSTGIEVKIADVSESLSEYHLLCTYDYYLKLVNDSTSAQVYAYGGKVYNE